MKPEFKIKIQIKACEASPSPPVGQALGGKGINIMQFCKEFNEKTSNIENLEKGTLVPVIISIYKDKSFSFITKSPPTTTLIKKLLKIDKGSKEPNKNKIANITEKQIEEIIKIKHNDLIVNSKNSAIKTIHGTLKSMGIKIGRD